MLAEDKLFTYVIIRGDLDMPAGKLGAQACHASRLSLLRFLKSHPERADEFLSLNSAGSMILLRGRHLGDLERAHAQSEAAGLPTALFTDSGHILLPHFDGSPVTTALAIGPATRESMRHITKRFRVVS